MMHNNAVKKRDQREIVSNIRKNYALPPIN